MIIVEAEMGETIDGFFKRAIRIAKKDPDSLVFGKFNGVVISVYPQSYFQDLMEKWYFAKGVPTELEEEEASCRD